MPHDLVSQNGEVQGFPGSFNLFAKPIAKMSQPIFTLMARTLLWWLRYRARGIKLQKMSVGDHFTPNLQYLPAKGEVKK
jgi:hypothetical protein